MAKRTAKSTRTKLAMLALFVACMSLPWVLPASGCNLDTRPLWGGRTQLDDEDAGEN